MKNTIITMFGVLVLTSSLVAQSALTSEAFSWSGELVALDDTARVLTVKSRVVGEQTDAEFGPESRGACHVDLVGVRQVRGCDP